MTEGAQARALVLDKTSYAVTVQTNTVTACKYDLRVRFDDGQTAETSLRVHGREVCWAAVGDLVPVRYDADDRTKIALDEPAMKAQLEDRAAAARQRAIERGERALEGHPDDFAERAAEFREQAAEFRQRGEDMAARSQAFVESDAMAELRRKLAERQAGQDG
jgi:hypothetical protein